MRNKSKFTPELKEMIERDIAICEETILTPEKTHDVFCEMKARYSLLYPDMIKGIVISAKIPWLSDTWEKELNRLKNALEVILVTKQEPQQSNPQVVVNIRKIKNTGNIGDNNQLTKSTEVGVDLSIPIQPK